MKEGTGQVLGIASVIMGALTFGIQIMGGLICGWIGWPLGIASIVTGIIAITQGNKGLGIGGIALSVVGLIWQIVILVGAMGSLTY